MSVDYWIRKLSKESKSLQKKSRFPGLHFSLSYIPSGYKYSKYLSSSLSDEELCDLHRISKGELKAMLKNYRYCQIHDDYFPSSSFTLDIFNVCDNCIIKHIELQKYVRNRGRLKKLLKEKENQKFESQLESKASNALGIRKKELKASYPNLLEAKVLQLKITQLINSKV